MADMTNFQGDTIFALSSAPGRAGVSVVRISGPKAGEVLRHLTDRRLPQARKAVLRTLFDKDGTAIDRPLVLWFEGPKSFTGEDSVELHLHGSVAILESIARRLVELGLRQALPGEFTRRAVEGGKMDLTEAEGLADLIDARSEGQRIQALQNMDGALRKTYEAWQSGLLDALAQIEGEIDFADEADVPDALSHAAHPILSHVVDDMREALATSQKSRAIRDGIQIAIIGAPNVGKSTLLNGLIGRDVAITSPQAGTTRDIIEAGMILAGLPVTFSDTAGLRESKDQIEAEGVRRAKARAEDAHLVIHVKRRGIEDTESLPADLTFTNLEDGQDVPHVKNGHISGNLLKEKGLSEVLRRLEVLILERYSGLEAAALTRVRHVNCIETAREAASTAMMRLGTSPELASEDIRNALISLEELAGRSDMEQVFDRIFSSFCIGK